MPDVRLVDLEVIKRYSLAIRQETAPAEELFAALEASLDEVEAVLARAEAAGDDWSDEPGGGEVDLPDPRSATKASGKAPTRSAASKQGPAKKAATKKAAPTPAAAKKAPAKKAAAKKGSAGAKGGPGAGRS